MWKRKLGTEAREFSANVCPCGVGTYSCCGCSPWLFLVLVLVVCGDILADGGVFVWSNHRWLPFCVSRSSDVLARWSSQTATSRPCLSKHVRENFHTTQEEKGRDKHMHAVFSFCGSSGREWSLIIHIALLFFWSAYKFGLPWLHDYYYW